MTETKFTSGPWKIITSFYGHYHIENEHDVSVCDKVLILSNANLISAAPDMYEALEESLEDIIWMSGASDFQEGSPAHEGWIKTRERLNKNLEILKKARGEE